MADDPYRWLNPEMRALLAEATGEAPAAGSPRVRFWPLRNDERVGHWLDRAYHAHAALVREALGELGITPSQATLLLDVNESRGRWTHDYLARRMRVTRSVVTRMLQRLTAHGLVMFVDEGMDRRQHRPQLSPNGEALVGRVEERLDWAERELLGRLRASQARWLMLVLPRLETAARRALADAQAEARRA